MTLDKEHKSNYQVHTFVLEPYMNHVRCIGPCCAPRRHFGSSTTSWNHAWHLAKSRDLLKKIGPFWVAGPRRARVCACALAHTKAMVKHNQCFENSTTVAVLDTTATLSAPRPSAGRVGQDFEQAWLCAAVFHRTSPSLTPLADRAMSVGFGRRASPSLCRVRNKAMRGDRSSTFTRYL